MEQNNNDDGSLAFLKIEPDKNSRHFNCQETTQQKLLNLSFWVIEYLEDVKTKFGENRFLVKIKHNKDDPESGPAQQAEGNNGKRIQTGALPLVGLGQILRQ